MRRAAALFLAACCSHAVAFLAPGAIVNGHSLRRVVLRPSLAPLRMSEDVDEIAALEAKLASLKRAKAEEAAAEVADNAAPMEEVTDGFDFATLSSRKKVASIKTAAPSELLSEAWKEEEPSDSSNGAGGLPIVQIAGAAVVAVALLAFSQVPVGSQNVDPVTYGGRDTRLETPDEIKARYEKVMNE